MPVYEYRCTKCEHQFELWQEVGAEPPACEDCGGEVKKIFHPVRTIYKTGGFYITDTPKKSGSTPAENKAEKSETKTESSSSESKSSETKSEPKSTPAEKSSGSDSGSSKSETKAK